jgi:hypothetical protein
LVGFKNCKVAVTDWPEAKEPCWMFKNTLPAGIVHEVEPSAPTSVALDERPSRAKEIGPGILLLLAFVIVTFCIN